ncbi:hypothetical protein, partial [Agromyces binzhouensis]|uniref:hypothetical protein n=1 Tax=Agromyces binzhouensis TaxID=1817495 RepID=UPI0013EB2A46
HAGGALATTVVVGAAAFAGYSAWAAVSGWRRARASHPVAGRGVVAARLRSADAAGMAVMALAMAAMPFA